MVNSSKRKVLRTLAALPLLAAPLPQSGGLTMPSLSQRAAALVWRLQLSGHQRVANPVSRLQREFRLGYTHACYLAHQLVNDGIWTLTIDRDGTRHALFGTQGQA
jgi:hypothetical protein